MKVEAWTDLRGNVHKTRAAAARADVVQELIAVLRSASSGLFILDAVGIAAAGDIADKSQEVVEILGHYNTLLDEEADRA